MSTTNALSRSLADCSDRLTACEYLVASEDYMAALRQAGTFQEDYAEIMADIVQAAFDNGATKKAIAAALNMPVSHLRGLVKRVPA